MKWPARPITIALGAAIAGLGWIAPHGAGAAAPVALDSAVYVERREELRRVLEPADRLRPGDRVVTIVTWKQAAHSGVGAISRGGGFTVTNPLPRALAYQGSGADAEEVSIDGGRSWGQLGAMRIGQRRATPEDVTHVRWRIISPAPEGRIAYSAIVR